MPVNLVQTSAGFAPSWRELSRRHLLQVGGLGLTGLTLPKLLAARTKTALAPKADHCVILFLNGGPSHLDMWDMKPDAADGIRGEFQPIDTSLPGYFVSDQMPKLARSWTGGRSCGASSIRPNTEMSAIRAGIRSGCLHGLSAGDERKRERASQRWFGGRSTVATSRSSDAGLCDGAANDSRDRQPPAAITG